ncbi:MAG: ATP-binding cassette domain-containing protein [Candidatus Limnocylindrales bacterium]
MNFNVLDGISPVVIALVIPVAIIQIGLILLAAFDLLREERRVRGGSKAIWAVIIVFVNLIGPIMYFLVGREEGPIDETPVSGALPGWGSPNDPPIVAPPVAQVPAEVRAAFEAPRAAPLPDAPPAIAVERLVRRYPGGVLALGGLDLSVPAGSVFGLLGPNGAGKTTCLRLLAGLAHPTSGRASVAGLDPARDPIGVRSRLGYLEQDPRAYSWMTGREQLRLVGQLHGMSGAALETAIDDALGRVALRDAADRRAGAYSGGMRQRLGIAGALVHRPPVVILDEPVSALDPEGRRDVLGLIASLRGETTVLFSSHVLGDVERICDRVAILDHGHLVVEGSLDELLERYAQPVWRVEAEPGEEAGLQALADRLRGLAWVTAAIAEHGVLTIAVSDVGVASRQLLPEVGNSGVAVVSVARARPTLEDVFLRLTGNGSEAAA